MSSGAKVPAAPLLARVAEHRQAAPGHFELVLEVPPHVAGGARPGQFLHVLCGDPPMGDGVARFLRRPFSLFWSDPQKSFLSILYRVIGAGTQWLSRRRPGEQVDLLGPLGTGFAWPLADASGPTGAAEALLVGGGVGIPPLFFLATDFLGGGVPVRAYLGARGAHDVLAEEAFRQAGVPLTVTTDDGSRGLRGRVTEPLEERLASGDAVIYACGPLPMLRAVQALAARYNLPAYLCLEERMACGVGACLGCPVAVASVGVVPAAPPAPVAPPGLPAPAPADLAAAYRRVLPAAGEPLPPFRYQRVCLEGPVFPAWSVILGDSSPAGAVSAHG